jgi:hypothetical protein
MRLKPVGSRGKPNSNLISFSAYSELIKSSSRSGNSLTSSESEADSIQKKASTE